MLTAINEPSIIKHLCNNFSVKLHMLIKSMYWSVIPRNTLRNGH